MNKVASSLVILALFLTLLPTADLLPAGQVATASAASTNLVKDYSFEGDITTSWGIWSSPDSSRQYKFFRSYNAPFGYGSYSAGIDASGSPHDPVSAIFSSSENAKFYVEAGQEYYLTFYARTESGEANVLAYIQHGTNFNPITQITGRTVNSAWQKYYIVFAPTASTEAFLAFAVGDIPTDGTLFLDGIQLFKASHEVVTTEVKGYIGDQNKGVKVTNISNFVQGELAVELPYFDPAQRTVTTKKFPVNKVSRDTIYFNMANGTFAGTGKVFARDIYMGQFNYNVLTRLTEISPSYPRVSEDLTVFGSGFNPLPERTFLVVKVTDLEGSERQVWVKPAAVDSAMTQMTFRLPVGLVSGSMFMETSFTDATQSDRINRSNSLSYNVKPVILPGGVEWKTRGYEQVGDTIRIHGQGLSHHPVVNFYDMAGVKIDYQRGKLVEMGEHEIIEVKTSRKANELFVTVKAGQIESDLGSAQDYLAKAKIIAIKTAYSRTDASAGVKIPAAKVGDTIIISGEGMRPSNESVLTVEFWGLNSAIVAPVAPEAVDSTGRTVKVAVPSGVQSGHVGIRVNGEISNYLSLEIVPTLLSVEPAPIVPGGDVYISAEGVGTDLSKTIVRFKAGKGQEYEAAPITIEHAGNQAWVRVKAPMALPSSGTTVGLQYGFWRDDSALNLELFPTITSVSMDMDKKILVIRGYGFSNVVGENQITYKYADEDRTVVSPAVKMLGVYPTEEGQEIRIAIQDDYHYGYVSVTVNGVTSNEENFGPVSIRKIARRVEYVPAAGAVMGVLYINGYNFGSEGGVKVGENWAQVHYRSDFFIIAVINQAYLYDNPVIVAKVQ